MSYKSGRHFLQIPGPTNVPDRILRAMDRPTIDHRGPEIVELALEVLHRLKPINFINVRLRVTYGRHSAMPLRGCLKFNNSSDIR